MTIYNWAKKKSYQASKAVGRRYGISYGRRGLRARKNSLSKLAKDVMMIKSSLNTEKKYLDMDETPSISKVGQCNNNSGGNVSLFVTPALPQGDGQGQRVGNSIKATGLVFKLNMMKQLNARGARRIKMYCVRSQDPTTPSNDIITQILDTNPMSGLRDYHSNLDYTQFKDGRFKIIGTKTCYLPQDSGDSTHQEFERQTKALTFAIKLNEVLRFKFDNDNLPANVRYHLIIVADNGNAGTSTSQLNDIFVTNANSGVEVKCSSRFWYVDN